MPKSGASWPLISCQGPCRRRTKATSRRSSQPGRVLSQADAEKRVTDVFDEAQNAKQKAADDAKAAADAARKTGVYVALWAFISLLVGAFSASYMATVGGRVRDDLPMTG